MSSPQKSTAEFRFYAELNDFLLPAQRQTSLPYQFTGHPGIKDPIEVFGIPHTEVALILVNGSAVGFDCQLQAGDRVSVYPVFKNLELGNFPELRGQLPFPPRFVLDVNLGKLAKRMRLLGFDSLYSNRYEDADVVNIAVDEQRIALTRDRRLLFAKRLDHGYWVRAVKAENQVEEVLQRFKLHGLIQAFSRCLVCNGKLAPVAKTDILEQLKPKTRLYYEVFYQCEGCRRVYWHGSHIDKMQQQFPELLSRLTCHTQNNSTRFKHGGCR